MRFWLWRRWARGSYDRHENWHEPAASAHTVLADLQQAPDREDDTMNRQPFKIGDRVRYTHEDPTRGTLPRYKSTGAVTHVLQRGDVVVAFDSLPGDGKRAVPPEHLELVAPATRPQEPWEPQLGDLAQYTSTFGGSTKTLIVWVVEPSDRGVTAVRRVDSDPDGPCRFPVKTEYLTLIASAETLDEGRLADPTYEPTRASTTDEMFGPPLTTMPLVLEAPKPAGAEAIIELDAGATVRLPLGGELHIPGVGTVRVVPEGSVPS